MSLLFEYLNTLTGAGGGGGGDPVVALSNQDVGDINSGSATAIYKLESSGGIIADRSIIGPISIGTWISPTSAAPGSYEVKADVTLGSVSGSATGSWLALTSNRQWSVSRSSSGVTEAEITVSIRLSGVTLATCTVYLSAEVA